MSTYLKKSTPIYDSYKNKIESYYKYHKYNTKGPRIIVPKSETHFTQNKGDTYEFEAPENLISFDGTKEYFTNKMLNLQHLTIDELPELKLDKLIIVECETSRTASLPEGIICFKSTGNTVNKIKLPSTLKSLIITSIDMPIQTEELPQSIEELCIAGSAQFDVLKYLKYLSITDEIEYDHLKIPNTVKVVDLSELNCTLIHLPDSVESLMIREVPDDMKIEGGKNVKYMQLTESTISPLPSVESIHIISHSYELSNIVNLKNLKEAIAEVEKFYLNGIPLHGSLEQLENHKKEECLMMDKVSDESDESD